MTATNGNLVLQVRQALDQALAEGRPAPGRPTLVRLTGATDHAVRKALAELAPEDTSPDTSAIQPQPASEITGNADGRLVAWAGFVFGSIMSIAANVLSTWLPAQHQPAGWSPGLAPQIGATVWSIGLLLSIEVLARWLAMGDRSVWRHRRRRPGVRDHLLRPPARCADRLALRSAGGGCRPRGARRPHGDLRIRPADDQPSQTSCRSHVDGFTRDLRPSRATSGAQCSTPLAGSPGDPTPTHPDHVPPADSGVTNRPGQPTPVGLGRYQLPSRTDSLPAPAGHRRPSD
jgi:hypothetical protein